MARLLIIGASLALLLTTAQADCKLCTTYVCTLHVDGYPVSWPPLTLSKNECDDMAGSLKKNDETDAEIKCTCEEGGQA